MSRRIAPLVVLDLLIVLGLSNRPGLAQPAAEPDPEEVKKARIEKARIAAREADDKARLELGDDANHLLKPGLVASKKDRTVRVRGYATGMKNNEAVEFFLIAPNSGKGYEALAVSLAKPSDIDAGLKFIGLTPGKPVDYFANRYWPRGPRVRMTFVWDEAQPDGNVSERKARVEEMLVLRNSNPPGKPLPQTGLVYVGGVWLPPLEGGGPRFHADVGDPGSIASNYNEPTTLLDLPGLFRQSDVYSSRIINPDNTLPPGQPVTIVLEPETSKEIPIELDLDLQLKGTATTDLKGVQLVLRRPDKASETDLPTNTNTDLTSDLSGALKQMKSLVDARHELFISVRPASELPVKTVVDAYKLLASLEAAGLRLNPPASGSGDPFYEAFLPDERLRDWKGRMWQPFELHLTGGDKAEATFRVFAEAEAESGKFTPKDQKLSSPQELAKLLADRSEQRRPLAVYLPGTVSYGELKRWVGPLLTEAAPAKDGARTVQPPVIWVYLQP